MSATVVFKKDDRVISREFFNVSSEISSLIGKIVDNPKIIDGLGDRKIIHNGDIKYCAEIVCLEWNIFETPGRETMWLSGRESYLVQTIVNQLDGLW